MSNRDKPYALFWGCLIQLRMPWIEVAARVVLPKLGITIVDLPFSCCPDPIAVKAADPDLWLTLAARNIALAEEEDLDILVMCSGCFESLMLAKHTLRSKEKCKTVNQRLKPSGKKVTGSVEISHIQQWLYEEFGLSRIASMVKHPLSGNAATHAGCHFTRPPEVLKTDHPVYPEKLDALCEVLGLYPVEYPDKNSCCGAGGGLVDMTIPATMLSRKLEGVRKGGADFLVAHCPSCIQSFDRGQSVNREEGNNSPVPVFHYLELLGLAIGIPETDFEFQAHHIPVTHL